MLKNLQQRLKGKLTEKKAFTIIEVIIVLTILVILISIMFFGGTQLKNNANKTAVKSDMRNYEVLAKEAFNENPSWAVATLGDVGYTEEDIVTILNSYFEDDLQFYQDADGNWISKRKDPWGTAYHLEIVDKDYAAEEVKDPTNTNVDKDAECLSQFRIYIRSYGRNKVTGSKGKVDNDDMILAVENVDNVITALYAAKIKNDGAESQNDNAGISLKFKTPWTLDGCYITAEKSANAKP